MKYQFCFLLLFSCMQMSAQSEQQVPLAFKKGNENYFSFNPFALAEPQIAIGIGFGNRFSQRSEYFFEISYLGKNPLYNVDPKSYNGVRFIAQYRYHFLQKRKSLARLNLASKQKIFKLSPFVGVEFRLKRFQFSDKASFINQSTNDTLSNFLYRANATSFGGAIVFGQSYTVSKNGKWKIELSAGFGIKQKLVTIINPSSNYKMFQRRGTFDWAVIPDIYESVSSPYFPFALRLRYVID